MDVQRGRDQGEAAAAADNDELKMDDYVEKMIADVEEMIADVKKRSEVKFNEGEESRQE